MLTSFPKVPLQEILPNLIEEGFIAYCGAGISIPAPTCAPSWWTLTEEILTAFFKQIPAEYAIPGDLIIKDKMFSPEGIFEVFGNILGDHFFQAFNALDLAEPNANHKLIARLAKEGKLKAVITTNFDIYIERALQEDGVDYQVVVSNEEFDTLFRTLDTKGLPSQFILCKIHGTIDKPESIIALASAYKSSGGFSQNKAQVFQWLLKRYNCLFLGYSGWDFEHSNYRKFWDTEGPYVKSLFWNRRINEKGGPKFPIIFNSCQQKFKFSEAELPDGWLSGLANQHLVNLEGIGLTIATNDENEAIWNQNKHKREEFLQSWAQDIPDLTLISTAIAEGVHFTAKFREMRDRTIQQAQQTAPTSPSGVSDLQLKMQGVSMKYSRQEITLEEYQKQLQEIQMEMSLVSIPENYRDEIKSIIAQNKFPGITDNPSRTQAFLQKMGFLLKNYSMEDAVRITTELIQREIEAMMVNSQKFISETTLTNWLAANMTPQHDQWKEDYQELVNIQNQFLDGTIPDQQTFQLKIKETLQQFENRKIGFDAPVEEWMDSLVKKICKSNNREKFIEGAEAFNRALIGIYARVNASLFKTPEYQALYRAANPKPPTQAVYAGDMVQINQRKAKLQQDYQAGTISPEYYAKESQAIQTELQSNIYFPPLSEPPQEIPLSILETYDAKIREPYKPLFEKLHELFPEQDSYPEMLIELAMLSLWIAGTQMIYMEKSQMYQIVTQKGMYPLIESHPSIVKYLYEHHLHWIEKGLDVFPRRFGQVLCRFTVELAEMADDLDLCRKATEKSLMYEDGKVTEQCYMKIPIALAAFYEARGKLEESQKYYTLGLEALRSQFIPPFADVIVYRAAVLIARTNEKKALQILLLGLPEYMGSLPPMRFPAKDLALKLAENLAQKLGYGTPQEALKILFSE